MTYAQEYGGQKLHLVEEHVDNGPGGGLRVSNKALCGRSNAKRGGWRMTIGLPLNHSCKNCQRVWRARYAR